MKSILSAAVLAVTTFSGVSAAHADPLWRSEGRVEQVRMRELEGFHELREARERFYAHWNGNPWARRRFERWYAERRLQLEREARYHRYERW